MTPVKKKLLWATVDEIKFTGNLIEADDCRRWRAVLSAIAIRLVCMYV